MAISFVLAGDYARSAGLDVETGIALQRTAVFITFMTQKVLRSAFTARSLRFNLWQIGFFTNKWSLIAAVITVVIALAAIYLIDVGMTAPPSAIIPALIGLGFIPPVVEEAIKFGRRQIGLK